MNQQDQIRALETAFTTSEKALALKREQNTLELAIAEGQFQVAKNQHALARTKGQLNMLEVEALDAQVEQLRATLRQANSPILQPMPAVPRRG